MWFLKRRRVRRRRAPRTVRERIAYEAYKEQTRRLIHERIEYWAPLVGVKPGRITIRDQRSRWGSCSTKGNLNFNYRLALIPLELVEYVVVHELCHLIEFNHSEQFWAHVARVLPDYQLRKVALHTLSKSGISVAATIETKTLLPV